MKNKNIYLTCFGILVLMFLLNFNGIAQEVNLQGETVNIVVWGEIDGRIDPFGGMERVKETENKFNVNINFIEKAWDDYTEELLSRLMSGDSTNDIWAVQDRHFFTQVAEDMFYPVSELLSEEYYDEIPPFGKAAAKNMSYKGNKYSFGILPGNEIILWGYNKKIFERENLPDPYDLYERGEWTYNRVTELAEEITKDTTGDGSIDRWGLGECWTFPTNAILFTFSNGAKVVEEIEGEMKFVYNSRKTAEALSQLHSWYEIDKVVQGGGFRENRFDYFPATQSFIDGNIGMVQQPFFRFGIIKEEMDDENWDLIPPPKGPSVNEYQITSSTVGGWTLPINVNKPEEYIKIIDYLFTKDMYDNMIRNSVGEIAPSSRAADLLFDVFEDYHKLISYKEQFILDPDIRTPIYKTQFADGEDPQAALDEAAPALQSIIDDLFN